MKRLLIICISCFLIQVLSCKKNEPETPNDEVNPVFFVNGIINGSSVNIQAGIDDYYMYSSNSVNTSNLHSFTGTLKKVNCSNCNQLSIQLNDNRMGVTVSSTHLDSLLNEGMHYHFDSLSTIGYFLFNAQPEQNATPSSYFWDFGDSTTSTEKNPTHVFYGTGNYTVCNTITYDNGCSNTTCNEVKANFYDCYAFIDYSFVNDSCFLKGIVLGDSSANPVTFDWNFGDTGSLNDSSHFQNPVHIFSSPGIYTVTMKTANAAGCNYTITRQIKTPSFNGSCTAYYSYEKRLTTNVDYSVVKITWTDESGSVYSTNNAKQPADSYFKIVSIENYEANEKGEPTKKINARVKCKLSNGMKSIDMNNVNVVFAISY